MYIYIRNIGAQHPSFCVFSFHVARSKHARSRVIIQGIYIYILLKFILQFFYISRGRVFEHAIKSNERPRNARREDYCLAPEVGSFRNDKLCIYTRARRIIIIRCIWGEETKCI